jgi:alpha-glucosidase (family GH31 glycosyl hydrolase)
MQCRCTGKRIRSLVDIMYFVPKPAKSEESFFGLGDKATEFNLRGKRLKNWNTDAYSFGYNQDPLYRSIPFYISVSDGIAHGIFFDNTFKAHLILAAKTLPKPVSGQMGANCNTIISTART